MSKEGVTVHIPRITFKSMVSNRGHYEQISQFPLRLCKAVTIHKSQGLTLDKILVYPDVWKAPGVLLVMLTRVADILLPLALDDESSSDEEEAPLAFKTRKRLSVPELGETQLPL